MSKIYNLSPIASRRRRSARGYAGEALPPETLTALVAALQKLGIVKDKTEVGA